MNGLTVYTTDYGIRHVPAVPGYYMRPLEMIGPKRVEDFRGNDEFMVLPKETRFALTDDWVRRVYDEASNRE